MYEFLAPLFGKKEDGTPAALTFEELSKKFDESKDIMLVNLKEGGYVSKEKFDAKETELKGVRTQLDEAKTTIQSYKDMDIDGIKQSAKDWEEKYTRDTADLQKKLADQETEFAARTYLGGFRFANDLVRDQVFTQFMAKQFVREGEKFLGADDFMKEMQTKYPTAFVADTPPADPPKDPPKPGTPYYAPPTPPADGSGKKRTLSEMMAYKNEHPDSKIEY
jgi:hypothetical protein